MVDAHALAYLIQSKMFYFVAGAFGVWVHLDPGPTWAQGPTPFSKGLGGQRVGVQMTFAWVRDVGQGIILA